MKNFNSEGYRRIALFLSIVLAGFLAMVVATEVYDEYDFLKPAAIVIMVVVAVILSLIPMILWKVLCWIQQGFKDNNRLGQ